VLEYPDVPRVEPTTKHVRVVFNSVTIAETSRAQRVLQRGTAPTYYIPADDVRTEHLRPRGKGASCPYKGEAHYFDVEVSGRRSEGAAWSYVVTRRGYEGIRNHLAFYPTKVDCFVDGEVVRPEPIEELGGWITSEIDYPSGR
jgi:uncharacterized protein (DUF427 family)